MANPYFRTRATNFPVTRLIYMVPGETLGLKVNGLGPDRQHLVIRATSDYIVRIAVTKVDNRFQEQDLTVTALVCGQVTLYGFEATAQATYHCTPGLSARCLNPLSIQVVSEVRIPDSLSSEQLALLRVLLAETIKPNMAGFNLEQAVLAMQYMRQTLLNRLAFPQSYYLDVPRSNPTLIGLIGSGAIEGFSGYPQMTQRVSGNIKEFMRSCNTGANKYFLVNRQLFHKALAIASGELNGPEYGTKLYAWRTKEAGSPGNNFRVVLNLQGQDFFTLVPEFIADPHGNKRGKK